jgi:uncharacterized protein (TIGR00730 family)
VTDNRPQIRSGAYVPAELDQDFLLGDSMRGVRFMLEFMKADEILRAWGIVSTVVVFGSARVREGAITRLPSEEDAAAASAHWQRWYDEARRFGRIVSERGGALAPVGGIRRNVIATGGGPGIMEAANRGAHDAGAPSIGFNIRLPREQEPNPYSTPELTLQFHYFGMRKMHLAMRAAAFVAFPGGFGTLNEVFEMLLLAQTQKGRNLPVLCFDRAFWTEVVNIDALMAEGMISAADHERLTFADDAEGAWAALAATGILDDRF